MRSRGRHTTSLSSTGDKISERQIAAIKAEDVERVAKKYINPATMQVVAVGDASKIKTDPGEIRPG